MKGQIGLVLLLLLGIYSLSEYFPHSNVIRGQDSLNQCYSTGPTCLLNLCVGMLKDGFYQYCGNCTTYLSCISEQAHYMQCPNYTVWDDGRKRCGSTSSTCRECYIYGSTTTEVSSTQGPTTIEPTTEVSTFQEPTTQGLTSQEPTTQEPPTQGLTSQEPTTQVSTTQEPTTQEPTTQVQTSDISTAVPTTSEAITEHLTTEVLSSKVPSSEMFTTDELMTSKSTTTSCKLLPLLMCILKILHPQSMHSIEGICCPTETWHRNAAR